MGFFDWHGQPGCFRDVTRHFDPGARLLDVGCGTAWLAGHLADYTGVDGSPDAVEEARRSDRNVLLHDLGDGPLPFEDASFDAVVLKDVLEHVPDPVATVTEVHRVLRRGRRVFAHDADFISAHVPRCPADERASSRDAQRWGWHDRTHRRPFTRKAHRLPLGDRGFHVEHVGYESVMPGTSVVAARTRAKRRPAPLRAEAWLPVLRRNVRLVARR